MPLKESVIEIPDSEDEPLTSSPVPTIAKLHVAPHHGLQASKEAGQDAADEVQVLGTGVSISDGKQGDCESLVVDDENSATEHVPTDKQVINDSLQPDVDTGVTPSIDKTLPELEPAQTEQESPRRESLVPEREEEEAEDQEIVEEVHSGASGAPAATSESDTQIITADVQSEGDQRPNDQDLPPRETPELERQTTTPHFLRETPAPQATEDCKADPVSILEQPSEQTDLFPATTPSPGAPKSPEMKQAERAVSVEDECPTQSELIPESNLVADEKEPESAAVESKDEEMADTPEVQEKSAQPENPAEKDHGALSATDEPNERLIRQMEVDPPEVQKEAEAETKPAPKASTPAKNSQEATIAELKAQRAALIAALSALPSFQELLAEDDSPSSSQDSDSEPTDTEIMATANKSVKRHIKLLHEYNEMKDAGQGLMGLIADQRGVRIVEIQDEFGIEDKD